MVPYAWLSNKDVVEQISEGLRLSKPPITQCPEEIWKIIQNCMKIESKERPTFAQIAKDLENYKTDRELRESISTTTNSSEFLKSGLYKRDSAIFEIQAQQQTNNVTNT